MVLTGTTKTQEDTMGTDTKSRQWDGELLAPTNWIRPHNEFVGDQCDNPDPYRCTMCNTDLVHISIKSADGRIFTAYLTPDQADDYAGNILFQSEMARISGDSGR
jgi:hypothetical protein